MLNPQITSLRLHNQLLARQSLDRPEDVVHWLGAIQSQDYLAAKWALGQRTRGATDAAIEQACNDGLILRTHVLRPTWHFVAPEDIRWMLKLTAPRVHAAIASYYRRLELDDRIFLRTDAILGNALQGGRQLVRSELEAILKQAGFAGFPDESLRLLHMIIHAELEGILCSGARRGKQATYALLEERVPPAKPLDREEALAELTRRYFRSRGPATLKDYAWWSGLSSADIRAGMEMKKTQLVEEVIDGQPCWLDPSSFSAPPETTPAVHLLPNYDEYIVGYTDRGAIIDAQHTPKVDARGNVLFNNTIVVDGQVAGTWKRTFRKDGVEVTPNLFAPLSVEENRALSAEICHYGQFLGVPL